TNKLETDRGDKRINGALDNVAATFKLPISVVNPRRSDADSFQDKRVPTINLHSMTNETIRIIPSPRDRIEAIHMDEYYDAPDHRVAGLSGSKFGPAAVPQQ